MDNSPKTLASSATPTDVSTSRYSSQPVLPNQYAARAGNPGPLGLFAFALVTFVLSVYNAAWPNSSPSALVSGAILYGGIAQFIAGLLDFSHGNTFSATTFCSFGAFWTGQGLLMLPIGAEATYGGDAEAWAQSQAVYHLAWALFTYILFAVSLKLKKGSILLSILLFFVGTTLLLITVSIFTSESIPKRVGGATGLVAAVLAWYAGIAELMVEDGVNLPVGAHNDTVVPERV